MVSYLSFGFLMIVARSVLTLLLLFTVGVAATVGIFGWLVSPAGGVVPILSLSILAFTSLYAVLCWARVDFWSTNLYTAFLAMRSVCAGILVVGVGALIVALLWCYVWSIAVMGIVNVKQQQQTEEAFFWNQGRTVELILSLIHI